MQSSLVLWEKVLCVEKITRQKLYDVWQDSMANFWDKIYLLVFPSYKFWDPSVTDRYRITQRYVCTAKNPALMPLPYDFPRGRLSANQPSQTFLLNRNISTLINISKY